jgi:RNA-binding protein
LHVSTRGSIIVRTEKAPSAGSKSIVFDKRAQEIGSIVDVFGPVKNPYVAIRPIKDLDTTKLVGQILYIQKR